MKNVRIWYQKYDIAKYISHLDLVRCMSRALKKANIPLWYTEGFNPHQFITFALPLSLGVTGKREAMDIKLIVDVSLKDIQESLNKVLPRGIKIIDVTENGMKPKQISFARYQILLYSKDISNDDIECKMRELLSQEEIIVEKKTKSGIKPISIKEYLSDYELTKNKNDVCLSITLPAGSVKNINPSLILQALDKYKNICPLYDITRQNLYTKDGKQFI